MRALRDPVDGAPRRGAVRAALTRSVPIFFSARLMAAVLIPLIAATIGWLLLAWFFWTPLVHWLARTLFSWGGNFGELAAGILAAIMLMLAAVSSALIAIAVLAMPVIVELVAARDFPELERRRGGTFMGSLVNALRATASFVVLWLLSLPLLLIPPVYVAVSIVLNANLNRRLLPYDALAIHADREELDDVQCIARKRLFMLGLCIAPLSLVPVVNLFASLYAGVAFTYLCLDELAALRAQPRLEGR